MENYIDVKVSVWNRIYFATGTDMQTVAETVKTKGVDAVMDISFGYKEQVTTLFETESEMSVDENNGLPTVEIYSDHKCIWDNSGREQSVTS